MNRYDAPAGEGEFEPGSEGRVLANKLGVTSVEEIDDIELELLEKLYRRIFHERFPERRLQVADLKDWHRQWLGNVYGWAGEERSVNMAKGDFSFAAASRIPALLAQFQSTCLDRFTPCEGLENAELVTAIAVTHAELVLIHPFREGNGRLARLLADVMAAQAGHDLLDYSEWEADRDNYFAAIRAAMDENYAPMEAFVRKAMVAD